MTYEEAIRKDKEVILIMNKRLIAKNNKNKNKIGHINDKVPMMFSKINKIIHSEYQGIEYIDVWKDVKISIDFDRN